MEDDTLTPGEITELLAAWRGGEDPGAVEKLIPRVFAELRQLANRYLSKERPDHTLQPTALVHEAYLRLAEQQVACKNRGHFFALAAKMMRRILTDHARSHLYSKRGGGWLKIPLEAVCDQAIHVRTIQGGTTQDGAATSTVDLLALNQALERLAAFDATKAMVVELRFFAGLSLEETAQTLGCSTATVSRHWLAARAWLYRELAPS